MDALLAMTGIVVRLGGGETARGDLALVETYPGLAG